MSYHQNDQHRVQRLDACFDPARGRTGQPHILARCTAHKHVLKRLGEERTASIGTLFIHPRGEVLVQQVKQDQGGTSEAVDDRRDDRVSDS